MSAEWAPKLQELEEMGFNDKELNRRLMMKNKGSLKRVVKEFVYMYKNPAGKSEE
jgi:next-to-BRCA1 protein 1